MKAVVLVGGEGTRLRPITETLPKPLVPLVDRPSLDHVLDHLAGHGVHEVVLSSSYLEETFHAFIQARRGDPSITWITETEPLGTGGAIVNALEPSTRTTPSSRSTGDILTDLDLTEMLASHRDRGRRRRSRSRTSRTLGRTASCRWTPRAGARVPREAVGAHAGDINAGTYVLDPAALEGWTRGETVSIDGRSSRRSSRQGGPRGVPVRGVLDGSRDAGRRTCRRSSTCSTAGWTDTAVPFAVRRRRRHDRPGRDRERARRRRPRATIERGAGERYRPARAGWWSNPTRSSSARSSARLEGDGAWSVRDSVLGEGRWSARCLGARWSRATGGAGRA
jgi:hypothetical protein